MTGQTGPLWPSATPPQADDGLNWELGDVADLPRMRAELRRHVTARGDGDADLRDRLLLTLDEMASNALRHGGGRVRASLRRTDSAYLVEVTDAAPDAPPAPAVGRDPSRGGLGLYLIAELSTAHGWYVNGDVKHVWALLPRA